MTGSEEFRTWRSSRGNRLPRENYAEGHPVHVTIGTVQSRAIFTRRAVADAVFGTVRRHQLTLAACLMPDHLHWLISWTPNLSREVGRFKSYTTRLAWRAGHHGQLWQRSFWDHVIRDEKSLILVARYIIGNPVRACIVSEAKEYPHQIHFADRINDLVG